MTRGRRIGRALLPFWIGALGLAAAWAVGEQSFTINQFGGMMEDADPLALDEGMAADSSNVITDLGPGLRPRTGYVAYSTEAAKAMWKFVKSDGTTYVIIHSTASDVLKADTGDKTFATTVSTVAASVTTAGAQLGDYFYFSNSADGLKRWDGTTASVVDTDMGFDKLVTWKGRLVGAGISGAERTLYLSKYLDGATWDLATNPSDDDPAQITVGGALDENISGLFASFKDVLIWIKNNSFGGLYGSRRSNFTLRTISETVGCNHPGTMEDCDGFLRFYGPRRSVWEFDGTRLTKISEGNNALFANVLNGESNTRSVTITSADDYDAGTLAGLTTGITEGSIVLSTWTDTDTTAADFGAGTLTYMSTTTSAGNLIYDPPGDAGDDASFESGTWFTLADSGERGAVSATRTTSHSPHSGSYHVQYDAFSDGSPFNIISGFTMKVYLYDGTLLGSHSITTPSSYAQQSVTMSSYAGRNVYFTFVFPDSDTGSPNLTSPTFYATGDSLTLYTKRVVADFSVYSIFTDLFEGTWRSTGTAGTFVSQTFDTGLTSAAWLSSGASLTTNGNSISFETQASTDGATWDSLVSWSTGSAPTSDYDRYIRYKVTMATETASTGLPYVSDVTFSARQTSGTYVSDSKSTGEAISSWNVFQADETLNDGTIVYGFYTDTDTVKTIGGDGLPVVGTFTSSQTITNNTVPTVSTGAYAFVSAKFDITAATQTPQNDRLTVSWNEGSTNKAEAVWTNQRYWLALSGTDSTTNDEVYVFDRRRQWHKYTGLTVDDFLLHNAFPLFANTSGIWQGETGTQDNGTDITSSYTTRYIFPAGPETRGYLRELWMTTTNSDATLATSLYLDGVSTPFTLGSWTMNEKAGYQVKKLAIPVTDAQMGRHVAIKWDITSAEQWRILNGSLYFDPDGIRE